MNITSGSFTRLCLLPPLLLLARALHTILNSKCLLSLTVNIQMMALLCSIEIGFWRCPCTLLSQGPVNMFESWLSLTVSSEGEGGRETYILTLPTWGSAAAPTTGLTSPFCSHIIQPESFRLFLMREADTGLYALSKMSGDTFPTLSRTIGFHSRSSSGGASMSHQSPS